MTRITVLIKLLMMTIMCYLWSVISNCSVCTHTVVIMSTYIDHYFVDTRKIFHLTVIHPLITQKIKLLSSTGHPLSNIYAFTMVLQMKSIKIFLNKKWTNAFARQGIHATRLKH